MQEQTKADTIQVAGDHYKKLDPEPWNVITAWDLGYLEGTALKYIARWKHKNGVEDLKKAIHFLQKKVEVEEQCNAFTSSQIEGTSKCNITQSKS